jgi:hypothetical protein
MRSTSALTALALLVGPAAFTSPVAAAPPSDDDLLAGAAARIERHRKADVVVTVRDAAGRPVPSARVEVEQTRHAFLFGCNYADPRWLPDDTAEARALQMARTDDCVRRFAGVIDFWDVVNEATYFERDELKKRAPRLTAMWQETGRVEFVRECFRHARAAGPKATLLINDYRTDDAYAALRELREGPGGRPFDVIGVQSHMHGGTWGNARVWGVCERFARFGVPLHFTETTILSGEPGRERASGGRPWPSTADGEKRQAEEVERFYTMLFSHPAVAGITWWLKPAGRRKEPHPDGKCRRSPFRPLLP